MYTGKVLFWDLGGNVSFHPQIQTVFQWSGDYLVPIVPNKYTTDIVQFIVDGQTPHCWSKQVEGYAVVSDTDVPFINVLFREGDVIQVYLAALICKQVFVLQKETDKYHFLSC